MTDLFEIEAPTTTTSLELRRLHRDAKRRQRRIHTLIASAVGLILLALAGSIAWNFVETFRPEKGTVADYTGYGQGQVQVIINPGEDGLTIGRTLHDNGVVASVDAFWNACLKNPDAAAKIQPGYYVLPKEMKAEFALMALLDRDRKIERNITIPEGYTLAKILDRVASVTGYSPEEVEAAAADTEAIGLPAEAEGNLEGWLFPSTYRFNPDVHPTDVLATMVSTTVSQLEGLEIPREEWETTLTFASLVEREAKLDADRPMVAGVIQNRLQKGQALELDSTIHYYAPTGSVFSAAEARAMDHPYNTYRYVGLPPGPIASPGLASLKAALAPEDHNYMYFVTVNLLTGETLYAVNFQDHQRNVEILRQWCRDNDGAC